MNALDRATQIGTEHGRAAGEAWFRRGWNPAMVDQIITHPKIQANYGYPRPEVHKLDDWVLATDEWVTFARTYEAAFTAAVEATAREACGEVAT